MPNKQASPGLRQFFVEEVQNDANSTLRTALWHLRDFYERGPEDPVQSSISDRIAETEELIVTYSEHTPLADFV